MTWFQMLNGLAGNQAAIFFTVALPIPGGVTKALHSACRLSLQDPHLGATVFLAAFGGGIGGIGGSGWKKSPHR